MICVPRKEADPTFIGDYDIIDVCDIITHWVQYAINTHQSCEFPTKWDILTSHFMTFSPTRAYYVPAVLITFPTDYVSCTWRHCSVDVTKEYAIYFSFTEFDVEIGYVPPSVQVRTQFSFRVPHTIIRRWVRSHFYHHFFRNVSMLSFM